MQPISSVLDSTFLKFALLSGPVQRRIHAKGTGATVKGIKASLLKTIEIPLAASLDEQANVAQQLQRLDAEANRLAAIYRRRIAALDELKQSLLHQAFSGNL